MKTDGAENAVRLKMLLQDLERQTCKVGFFEDATYPEKTRVPVAYIAAIQEFGSPKNKIPPRSFMRTTAKENAVAWKDLFGRGVVAAIKGRETAYSVYRKIGIDASGKIQKKIIQITTPPLKDGTVKARKRRMADGGKKAAPQSISKPLVDTGQMLASVTHQVTL